MVLAAGAHLLDAGAMRKVALEAMGRDPFFFVEKAPSRPPATSG